MTKEKKYNVLRILITVFWVLAGAGTVALLIAAMNKKNSMRCKTVEINIKGVQNNFFIDKEEVRTIIQEINNGKLEGVPVSKFNLQMMESALKKNIWIKKAELFFDNNEHLKVEVLEREPVARIFTDKGNSFYIDSSIHILPLSDKTSARIPVFTGYVETSSYSRSDSLLFKDIAILGEYILNDPFWMAQVEQVDIQAGRQFEMIPKMGNQLILFGGVENHVEKFSNLLKFYKEVLAKTGWNKYSKINVQYKGQIVAVRRDAADIAIDSIRSLHIMQAIVTNTQARVMDSISNIQLGLEEQPDVSVIASGEREEISEDDLKVVPKLQEALADTTHAKPKPKITLPAARIKLPAPVKPQEKKETVKKSTTKPVVKTVSSSAKKTEVKKPPVKKAPVKNDKPAAIPKTVMPPKNDY